MRPKLLITLIALVVTSALSPELAAQRLTLPQSADLGWAPASAGLRAGYEYSSNSTVLGAQIRVPALPSGHVEVVPNAEVAFLTGLREYQGGVDVVFVTGGRRGGLYGGGGIGWRNTLYEGPDRETRLAPTVVVGARSSAFFGPVGTQFEMRWSYPEGPFRPRTLTLGFNVNLWGRSPARR